MKAIAAVVLVLLCTSAGAERPASSSWSFDQEPSGIDQVRGFHALVPGVAGKAMRFDGQTTVVIRKAASLGRIDGAFSVDAWVAIQEYPWTWCAIVDQEKAHRAGYFFGIDPDGRFGLHLAVNGKWQQSQSDVKLPLYAWNHLAATFDPAAGIRLYCNGTLVGRRAVRGTPTFAPAVDAWLGRNHTPLGLSHEVKVVAPVAFSFNGLIDEVQVRSSALSGSAVQARFASLQPKGPAPLGAPALPAGPKGPGRFGAYYTRLKYSDDWENPWRVGDAADVVVRFDETPTRLVFWRGTSYIPAWVTENGIWYTNEFYETQSDPMTISSEPMADKQARFSHATILESTDARVVVRWRYAPVTVNYELVHTDPLTGWGDWVEEDYTVYPDGACVRKITVYSSSPYVIPGKGPGTNGFRQYHEAIIINPPATRPEDNIKTEALTLTNMKGESHTYSWADRAPGETAAFDAETMKLLSRISDLEPQTHKWLMQPPGANILQVNLKARYSPYVVVDPRHVAIDCYAGEIIRERSMFPWWNHWPVSQQIRSNGRWAIAPDRASHSSLAHIQSWEPYEQTPTSITMLMLNGLTDRQGQELVPLAKSWLHAPAATTDTAGFKSEGFDRTQRAFVIARDGVASTVPLTVSLQASQDSPVVNPAIVIKNWGASDARIEVDGTAAPQGKEVRIGHVPRLEGDDLVVWIRRESASPIRVTIGPS
ncbi:MAG: LamG domain-containing protein [Bacteroidales bacterium]